LKIKEIYIYGYGKFENRKFSNIQDQQVFFGENEAGKSTIMAFIHSILFGFPTKQQSELRYEPKKGAKYGGQMTVLFPDKGTAVIERVKGKATGDVVVRLENGIIGGEELLKELLSSIDKQVFQAIFSFNLHGLQNVHQMKGEDLGRFLFSTGTIGTDRLLKAENELTKELENRFKPNGRNPKLNSKLKDLRGLRNELRRAEENNDQYISLLKKRELLETKIKALRSESMMVSVELTRLEEWKKVFPLIQKEKQLLDELSHYEELVFPDKGLEEFERLKQYQLELERKRDTLKQRIEHVKDELHSLMPNSELIDKENELMKAVESISLLEKWKQENIQLQVKMKKLDEDILLIKNKMHLPLEAKEILSINTSIFMKEKAAELQAKQKRLAEKKLELDDDFKEEKRQLEELEAKEYSLKGELLPEMERKSLQEQLSRFDSNRNLADKYEEIKNRLALLKASEQKSSSKVKSDKLQYMIFAGLFLILCGWGVYADSLMLIIAGGVGMLFAIISYLRIRRASDSMIQIEIQQLQKKKLDVETAMRQPKEHIELMEQKLNRDTKFREQLMQVKSMLDRQQEMYDQVIDRFEAWERDSLQLDKEIVMAGEELRIPREIATKYLYDSFELIDGLKKHYQDREYLIAQYDSNQSAIQEIVKPLRNLIQQFLLDDNLPLQEAALLLKRSLREELNKQVKYQEKNDLLSVLQDEYQVYQLEWKRISSEISNLFSAASARDELHFRELAKKGNQKSKLMESLNQLQFQLKLSSFKEEEAKQLSRRPVEIAIQEILDKREKQEAELTLLQDELAAIKYDIQTLEDGGSYAELLHRFKQLNTEFEEEAREWARFAVAKELLQKTVNKYKQERLPKMLSLAEGYLEFLTEGRYYRIIPKQEGSGFLIESSDHLLYEANELSQATTEQIYISLRLALALTVYEKYKFPIIIDDSFVNFDSHRTSRVTELLKQLTDYQILFFTCHEHLLDYYPEAEITHLNKQNSVSTK